MAKIITAAQAAKLIKDKDFIAMCGVNFAGVAMEVIDAIVDRYKEEGHPRGLSLMHSGGNAYGAAFGIDGLVDTYYAGFTTIGNEFIDGNKIAAYSLTQGVATQFYRAQAADYPYLTRVGLHTYIDPRNQGCATNEKARANPIVELVEIDGEEWLHFKIPPIKVALIRATTADVTGNLINDDESIKHEILPVAMAAHNNGGIVIAQVKNLVELGEIDAADVKVPGMLVDYIVVCSDQAKWQPQQAMMIFQPGLTGHVKVAESTIPFDLMMPKADRLVMARRGLMELWPGCISNVGIGASDGVAMLAVDEGLKDMFYMTNELGAIGGITAGGPYFSAAFNARAYINHHEMFDFYNGHGLNITFLGAAEITEDGSVNVTRIAGRTNGSGGFVNISSSTPKVVFLCSFEAGCKAVPDPENGTIKITKPGKAPKFVKEAEQIAFSGKEAVRKGQEVMYITERAVFKLIDGKVTLIEYAPGFDIEKDIIDHMGFRPAISPDLKEMPACIFAEEGKKMGMKEKWEAILAEKGE